MKSRKLSLLQYAAATLLLLAVPAAAGAQELAAWFSKPANQGAYGVIAEEARTLSTILRGALLSESLIAARLEEGARKHVPPSIILATLKEDTSRFVAISASLRSRSLLPNDSRKASATVEQINLLLRAGVDEKTLDAALDAALKKLGGKDSAVPVISRAVAALSVVATARAQYGLSARGCPLIAAALVESDLSDGRLDSVLAALGGAISNGELAGEALSAAIGRGSKGTSEGNGNEKGNQGGSGEGKGSSGKGKGNK